MKRVSKNLTKAVTLSVLLMLPYGMAQAAEYVVPVRGEYDRYNEDIKTHYNETANTVEAFVYDFSNDKNTKITNKNSFYPYVINPIRSTVIIKDNELIELNGSVYGIYTENIDNAGNVILGYNGDDNIIINKKYLESENLKKDIINNLGDVKINISGAGNGQIVGINNTASESVIASGHTEIYVEGGNTVSGVNNKGSNNAAILLKSANITSIASAEKGLTAAYGVSAFYDTSIEMLGEAVITTKSIGDISVDAYGIYAQGTEKGTPAVGIDKVVIQTEIDGKKENLWAENIGIKSDNALINIENGAEIDVISKNNNAKESNNKIYGIWSTNGGNININGTTEISTSGGQEIAVVAGTEGWKLGEDGKLPVVEENGINTVNLNYQNGAGSDIKGDIISGYGGNITIGNADGISTLSTRNNAGTLNLTGDALSANGGKLSINLTSGSTWTGRADDYQDAALPTWKKEHEEQFNPKFSNSIEASGNVKVNLAQGAKWNVTGQSWITELDGNGVVDLTKGKGSDAVHIGTVKGNNTFVVNLKPDGLDTSDMIYVKNGTNEAQTLQINNRDEVLSGMKAGDALRFATVTKAGEGFGNITDGAETFGKSTTINDAGIFNVDFDIIYKDYNEKMEGDLGTDQTYNGGNFSTNKPGQDYVDNVYGGKKDTSEINTLEETTETESNPKHVYLVRKENSAENKSDAGKTIINMSRANYKNAIYMDRLNKRMGEMRYVNGEEGQGLWVRLRHDRIGQSGDFRSMNTMYEVGYDVKQPTDNGEHRIGMAIDYMRGSTTYDDIMGKGETKRYGLWLYDTWLGEKGHYVDYVAKWGHLSNDFDITAKTTGEKITGDYSNNVFSVSAEYGKKNDMGNNWYFEPQAQLQLARVTGADYVTTQGSKVNVDGINSLIGRAGFRIGRDMDENSTVYLKADLLHEFMGDQTVTAADATGTLREEFENKGTWYDVGFGFATKMSKNSYAFMDFEKSFGNDNDETYQINAGMQWSF